MERKAAHQKKMKLQNRPSCSNNGTQDSILVLGDRVALVVVGVG